MKIKIFGNAIQMSGAAAGMVVERARRAAAKRGKFSIALSGGSTPLGVYSMLGMPPLTESMPWEQTHVFWGDERCVAPDRAESNFRAAVSALGPPPGLSPENLHRIPGEKGPEHGARAYEQELIQFFSDQNSPVFDLVLLGLGSDGHTASLFPESPVLDQTERWVMGADAPDRLEPKLDRITLTLPVINAARRVVFLVSGLGKAMVVRAIREGAPEAGSLPAARVQPPGGALWLIDRAAAGETMRDGGP